MKGGGEKMGKGGEILGWQDVKKRCHETHVLQVQQLSKDS